MNSSGRPMGMAQVIRLSEEVGQLTSSDPALLLPTLYAEFYTGCKSCFLKAMYALAAVNPIVTIDFIREKLAGNEVAQRLMEIMERPDSRDDVLDEYNKDDHSSLTERDVALMNAYWHHLDPECGVEPPAEADEESPITLIFVGG